MCKVIICVRVKNEERWLRLLIRRLILQTFKDFELVIVDNQSTDYTKKLAENAQATLVDIDNYNPSAAINTGIKQSKNYKSADIAVILSAHCIPVSNDWLEKLINSFDLDKNIVGVYGRQIPMRASNPDNMRDLLYTFGEKSFTHNQNIFFHNANSALKMEYFRNNQFDETISHIEDFAWALDAKQKGKKIYYCSDAKVWHKHGLHQHSNASFRSKTVSETLRQLSGFQFPEEDIFNLNQLKTIVVNETSKKNDPKKGWSERNKSISHQMNIEFFTIPPDPSRSLFSRFEEVIPEQIKVESDLIFFWSDKYGPINLELIFERHEALILDGGDAVIPMRALNKGICVSADTQFMKFTEASAIYKDSFFTTSFGRGALFWSDSMRVSDLNLLKLSKAEI